MTTLHDKIVGYLKAIITPAAGVANPDKKHNAGPALYDVFIWQEIAAFAKKELEEAWEALEQEGLLKSDDVLRALDIGEHIALESNAFSCLVTVGKSRNNFDKDKFIETLAHKFKVSKERLEEIAEVCVKTGKAPLQKRVLEV